MNDLKMAWTTVETYAQAEQMAREAVAQKWAICVQIEGRIQSVYRWKNKIESAPEYRICFKFFEENQAQLEKFVCENHPYETPEWVSVSIESVGERYARWAQESR